MAATIIDGRAHALKHEQNLKQKISQLKVKPRIVSLLVGDDPSSLLYSRIKRDKAESLGIGFEFKQYPKQVSLDQFLEEIYQLNNDPSVTGLMIQLPFPENFLNGREVYDILRMIEARKDVDGLSGQGPVPQATVRGVLSLLENEKIELKNKKVLVVGSQGMVGKDLVKALWEKGIEANGADIETTNLKELAKEADLLFSAVGQKNLITADSVKEGVVVIDIGGDIDFEEVAKVASKITPPKGGVGPMTVISLMENAVDLALNYG